MANPRSLLTLAYILLIVLTLSDANSTSKNSGVSSHSQKVKGNVYNTNNSFCAGPSKKIEALLRDVKKELSEMREEIKSLKGKNTTGKGIFKTLPFNFRWTHV